MGLWLKEFEERAAEGLRLFKPGKVAALVDEIGAHIRHVLF